MPFGWKIWNGAIIGGKYMDEVMFETSKSPLLKEKRVPDLTILKPQPKVEATDSVGELKQVPWGGTLVEVEKDL